MVLAAVEVEAIPPAIPQILAQVAVVLAVLVAPPVVLVHQTRVAAEAAAVARLAQQLAVLAVLVMHELPTGHKEINNE